MALQISDTTPRIQYTATSGQTNFAVPFEFFAVADLKVYNGTTLLTYNNSPSSASQYSVTGAGVTGGGSITLGSPGATLNDSITIVRDLAIERLSDFPVSGNFPIQTLNSELDKIVAMLQQLEEQFARTLQYPVTTTTGFAVDLPELVANRVLSVNADATALLANQELGTFKGNWAASTSYQIRDLVKDTSNGNIYFVNAAHTSSGSEPLSSNANSSKYDLIIDAASATTSATNAATSASAAASSASAASTSASNAATSESNAATSESNASTSESNASTSATNASNSATAASTSASNAATSESNASTSASNAASSASAASSSATSASNSASTATTQASNASTSASNAATSASNASTSESNAATSESNAATSETNASNAQTAAETAQAAAEAAADSIDDTYLGAKASNPTVDNDGDPLTVGDWYFNTTSNQTFIYNGSSWDAIAPDLIGDATPQLGGDLDLNSNDITGTGNINITGTVVSDGITNEGIIKNSDNEGTVYDSTATDGQVTAGSTVHIENRSGSNLTFAQVAFTPRQGYGTARVVATGGSTPDLFFTTDSANRIQINGNGDISFYEDTGTTAKLTWDASAESLGIGTSSPSAELHISKSADGGNAEFLIENSFATAGSTDETVQIQGRFGGYDASYILTGKEADFTTSGNRSSFMSFWTRGAGTLAEAMRINSSGNVGIGTSSPAQILQATDADGTGFVGIRTQNNNANLGLAGIEFSSDPTYSKAAIAQLRLNVNGNGPLLFFVDSATDAANWSTGDEKMRIDSSGNVGIGTSSPSAKLEVNGDVLIPEATLTDGATISWDVSTSPVAKVTLGGNRTISAPSNSAGAGQFISLLVIQDGTGSRTLTWNAVYEFASDTAPTLTTTGGKGDLFVFRYNGTKWLEVGRNLNLSLS